MLMQPGEGMVVRVTDLVVQQGDLAWVQHPTLGKKRIVEGTEGADTITFRIGMMVRVALNHRDVIVEVQRQDF